MLLLVLSCLSWIKYFVTAPSIRNKYDATWLGWVAAGDGQHWDNCDARTHTHPSLEAPAKSLNLLTPIALYTWAMFIS